MNKLQEPSSSSTIDDTSLKMTPRRSWWRYKRTWVVVCVLLLIGGTLSFVAVSKLPFLRNLVYAMGYTPDEAQKISFLKALFSWNEHAKMMRGELPDPDEVFILGGAFDSAKMTAQNKLIDLRAVNQSLQRRGQQGDELSFLAIAGWTGKSDKLVVPSIKNKTAFADTQANNIKNAEVFFGEDISAIMRDKNDGFNSTNSLKKVTNPPVSGTGGDTWFDRLVDKAIRADAGLSGAMKSEDRSATSLAKVGNLRAIGDSRAKRDMYYAWLMGRAARRTPQVILKKTLASSSFDGAELPRTVFSSAGFSGVGINSDDIVADMDNVQKYLDQDKNCQQALNESYQMSPDTELIHQQIESLSGSFPATCEARGAQGDTYSATLNGISSQCQQMRSAYGHVQQGCSTLSIDLQDSQCQSVTLSSYYSAFNAYCEEELAKCADLAEEEQATCIATANALASADGFTDPESGALFNSKDQLEGDISHIFYGDSGDEKIFDHGFFPGVNWGNSRLVDSSIAD